MKTERTCIFRIRFSLCGRISYLLFNAVFSLGISIYSIIYVLNWRNYSCDSERRLVEIKKALHEYVLDCGQLPTSQQGVMALIERPVLEPIPDTWAGPYLGEYPGSDLWNGSVIYLSDSNGCVLVVGMKNTFIKLH